MKLNVVLPSICALALLAGVASLYLSNQKKDAELTTLREENKELQSAKQEFEDLKTSTLVSQTELQRLRKDNEDLLRLRNEARQLRDEKQKLSTDVQRAKTEAERAQSQAQAARASAEQMAQQQQQAQPETQRRTGNGQSSAVNQLNACINNLRQIDGATQQWALENGKTATNIPTPQDITPYLSNNSMPVCPAGGVYTLNAVSADPTCSIPGHTLTPPTQ